MFKVKSEHSYKDVFEGILIGGSLVALTTFIFGTKQGKEFQKGLLDKYHVLKRKAEEFQGKLHKVVDASPQKGKKTTKTLQKTVKKILPKSKKKSAKKSRATAR
ncbi:MAG: hypothetical protein K2Y01_07005 [Rhabdochlamydiaceae bacterium]|nr:hypothetical protein [Rhabdochlamydiaceae bacterium]